MQKMNSQNPLIRNLIVAKQKVMNIFYNVIGKSTNQSEWYCLRTGNQLLDQGLLLEATGFYKNLMHQKPESYISYVGLAEVARMKQDWKTCIDFYSICFKQFPENEKEFWYLHLAEAQIEQNSINEAVKTFETCSKKYPNKVASFEGLAILVQKNSQWQRALDYWQICFERFPDKIRPLWHQKKQRVLLELGQTHNAQQEALARVKMQGGEKYVEIIRQKLENMVPHSLNYQHILIITYGRSGSTLLQGILNTIDGVLIRGENDNIFFNLFKTYKKLIKLKNHHKTAVLPNQPWYGISFIDENLLMTNYRELAKGILLAENYAESNNLCLGFKEIRYDKVGDDFESYLDFLRQLFPKSAFIFNTRNLKDVSKSAWWKNENAEDVVKELSMLETKFEAYSQKYESCFRIDYKDIISKGDNLEGLFTFLGASYHPEIIDIVLSTPHSYSPEQQHIKKLFNEI